MNYTSLHSPSLTSRLHLSHCEIPSHWLDDSSIVCLHNLAYRFARILHKYCHMHYPCSSLDLTLYQIGHDLSRDWSRAISHVHLPVLAPCDLCTCSRLR